MCAAGVAVSGACGARELATALALVPPVVIVIAAPGAPRFAGQGLQGGPHTGLAWLRRVNRHTVSPFGVTLSLRPDALQLKQCKDYRLPRCLLYTCRPFGLLTTPSG